MAGTSPAMTAGAIRYRYHFGVMPGLVPGIPTQRTQCCSSLGAEEILRFEEGDACDVDYLDYH